MIGTSEPKCLQIHKGGISLKPFLAFKNILIIDYSLECGIFVHFSTIYIYRKSLEEKNRHVRIRTSAGEIWNSSIEFNVSTPFAQVEDLL